MNQIEERIEEILNQMTTEEKCAMCRANSKFTSAGVERLGISELKMSDGPHGVREEYERHHWIPLNRKEDHCTYLPTASALASTWNEELAYSFGDCLGGEARARGKDIILGPGVNLMRSPLCGRNFEYYSEDPTLTAKMAVPVVQGIQKNDVAACVKHYALNNQELARNTVNVECDSRTLHEIYLKAFEKTVKEGHTYSIMGAYNRFHGQFCCHNKVLVKDILKGQWDFDGVYLTDWSGCHDTKEAAYNGLDIEMGTSENYDEFYFAKDYEELVKNDEHAAKELDDKVRRILRLMMRINKDKNSRSNGEFNTERHQKIAYDIASEAITLLKNDDNILPLDKNMKNVLVIGDNANVKHALGGNSSYVRALYEITPFEGLKNRYPDIEFEYLPYQSTQEKPIKTELLDIVDLKTGCRGFRREKYDNVYCRGKSYETKYFDNAALEEAPKTEYTYRYYATVTAPETDTYKLTVTGKRGTYLIIDDKRVLRFDADEAMKKSHSVDLKKGEKLKFIVEVQPLTPYPVLDFGWSKKSEENNSGADVILEKAKNADKVIFFGGLNHDYDTEGMDRKDMKLPQEQNVFIEKLLEIRKDSVIYIFSGAAVEMPWVDKAKALVWSGYLGMEGGNAVADVLFGEKCPCGHLPFTMPYKYEDTSVYRYGEYNDKDVTYNDGMYIGYRGFDKDNIAPMFRFGFGLSYTEFVCSDVKKTENTVSAVLTNKGKRDAKTVVSLYAARKLDGLDFPKKELVDFHKVSVNAGKSTRVSFDIKEEYYRYFDEKSNQWKTLDDVEFFVI